MADSIEQKLMDAVVARMQTIRVTNGYKTDIGSQVADSETQWDQVAEVNDNGSLSVFHLGTTTPDDDGKTAFIIRLMTVGLQATFKKGMTSAAAAALGRKITADLYKAIGTDTRWTVSNVALAMLTREKSHAPAMVEGTFEITGIEMQIEIQYHSLRFNLEV